MSIQPMEIARYIPYHLSFLLVNIVNMAVSTCQQILSPSVMIAKMDIYPAVSSDNNSFGND